MLLEERDWKKDRFGLSNRGPEPHDVREKNSQVVRREDSGDDDKTN